MTPQSYLKQHDPQRLTGDDLMQFRKGAQEMLKSGNEAAVLTAISIMKLLGHIDYMTLEGMKK